MERKSLRSHSLSCVISVRTQSYSPLRRTAWQFLQLADSLIEIGAPQLGQLPSINPVLLTAVTAERRRRNDQISVNGSGKVEPGAGGHHSGRHGNPMPKR